MSKNPNLGNFGENLVSEHLSKQGFQITSRNVVTLYGEIDIIAQKGGEIYFIEVKSRSGNSFGEPIEAITKNKLDHIKKSALFYLEKNKFSGSFHFLVASVYKKDDRFLVNSVDEIEEF